MALLRHLGAKSLKGAGRPLGHRKGVAKGLRDRLFELVEGAAEELAAGLELGPQAEEPEAVVTRHVEPAAELIEQEVEARAPLGGEAAEPFLYPRI